MKLHNSPYLTGSFYILFGGIVLFAAIFFGIRAGLALKSAQSADISPEDMPNLTSMKIGDAVPDLVIHDLNGVETSLTKITHGKRTITAVLMPGCEPCETLLNSWLQRKVGLDNEDYQVILLAANDGDSSDLEEIEMFTGIYNTYTCDRYELENKISLSTFPSLIGINNKDEITFISNGFSPDLDSKYYSEHL
ncbi:MAG: hypothetical protein KAR42_06705 [candidate division Zixibacteria bacterium]|nr:hypothetical protein [candidate division Zixibacteria bacterium]